VSRPSLAERVVLLEHALARIPHAFGGALALAYYAEPRATIDIDLNVFVPAERWPDVAAAARPLGIDVGGAAATIERDGQARVLWDDVPIDLFFGYDPFHDAAARGVRTVPFADTTIAILDASHLVVCKVVFDRPRDWVDIDAMLDGDAPIDVVEVMRWVGRIAGDEDPRYARILSLMTHDGG
jgi:hypothetical protein